MRQSVFLCRMLTPGVDCIYTSVKKGDSVAVIEGGVLLILRRHAQRLDQSG